MDRGGPREVVVNPAPRGIGISLWWRAVRAYSFPASAVPVLVGAALALEHGDALWGLFPVVLLCSVLFQAGTNAINDYFDFIRGVDEDDPRSGSSGVLTRGLLWPNAMFVFGVCLFGAGVLLGLVLVYQPGFSAVTSTRVVPKAISTSRLGTCLSSRSWVRSLS